MFGAPGQQFEWVNTIILSSSSTSHKLACKEDFSSLMMLVFKVLSIGNLMPKDVECRKLRLNESAKIYDYASTQK